MARMIIPKNTASVEEVIGAMQIYYDANDWVSNADYIHEYKARYGVIGDDTDSSAYTKKTEIGAYYGFIEWEDITRKQSPRRITPRGKVFLEHYRAGNIDAMHEDIMCALEEVVFGRNNYACCSCDSDVEPPSVFLRAMIDLGYLTNSEFAFLIYKMEYEWRHYTDLVQEIRQQRNSDILLTIPEEARKFKDPKPILILERWGVLVSTREGNLKATKIAPEFYDKYKNRLKALKIYNVDKNLIDASSEINPTDEYLGTTEIVCENIPSNLSIEDLGIMLAGMYNSVSTGSQSNAVRMFGIKYGGIIIENGYTATAIVKASGIRDSYDTEVSKGVSIYKSIKDNEYGIYFADELESTQCEFDYSTTKMKSVNKIFYGVPGCGKSYHIEHDILGKDKITKKYSGDYEKDNIIRTTFYQDYSNTDFVGQILPKITKGENGEKDTVEYIFNPGPFTLALIRAISNPTKKVALVIEEINRGNAPAIFGDIFQLLDRDDDSISEYGIVNVGMLDYLNDYEFDVDGEKKRYSFKEIKIPGNMDIFATMNTSDQNVYTLDTAFTRRWAKERVANDFDGHKIKDMIIPGMEQYTWGVFVEAVNDHIQGKIEDLQVNEDKQIGAFFVKEADLLAEDNTKTPNEKKEMAKAFAYKVLEYLWDDVSKLDHSVIFNTTYKTFEKLVEAYLSKGVEVFNNEIFKNKPVRTVTAAEEETVETPTEETN